jgi:dephospho-CoA kinase
VRTVRIGLVGPIGCGKSTIAGWLAGAGAVVIDADAIARQVTDPGGPARAAVVARFGSQVVAADGSLDRVVLASIVFTDPAALADLEAIVHPAVRPIVMNEIERAERSAAPADVIEAIKLVESGLAGQCDEVWLVTCSAEEQRERLAGRAMDAGDVDRRIEAQGDLRRRLAPAATMIIDASGPPESTRERVLAAFAEAIG